MHLTKIIDTFIDLIDGLPTLSAKSFWLRVYTDLKGRPYLAIGHTNSAEELKVKFLLMTGEIFNYICIA